MALDGTRPADIESSSRRFDAGSKNAETAFRMGWYKMEVTQPLRRLAQTPVGLSARALPPVQCALSDCPAGRYAT